MRLNRNCRNNTYYCNRNYNRKNPSNRNWHLDEPLDGQLDHFLISDWPNHQIGQNHLKPIGTGHRYQQTPPPGHSQNQLAVLAASMTHRRRKIGFLRPVMLQLFSALLSDTCPRCNLPVRSNRQNNQPTDRWYIHGIGCGDRDHK